MQETAVTLEQLRLSVGKDKEVVSILVGPNGSGKSSLLRDLAGKYRGRDVAIVSNTPHDRFARMQGVQRIAVGRNSDMPAGIVKRALMRSLDERSSLFHQISSILEYCRYRPRFGFRIKPGPRYKTGPEDLTELIRDDLRRRRFEQNLPEFGDEPDLDADLERAVAFLQRHHPREEIWIDANRSALEYSLDREFVSILRFETLLRKFHLIRSIEVLLERDGGYGDYRVIEMQHASSGQLALISSLLFLITHVGEDPLIIIDEPENSLHPNWQREYVDLLLAAMNYRSSKILIATHAPLVVTGALTDHPDLVSVFAVRHGEPEHLEIDADKTPNSIEEILWEAFEVVTPANHFVSETLVEAISQFEGDAIAKDEVLQLINDLDRRSFDPQQKEFFSAVREIVDKVEAAKARFADRGDDLA